MDSQIIFSLFFVIILGINLSFIFKAHWWRNFQIYTLKKEEKWAKKIPFYRKLVEKEMKFAKGKYGLWLFRSLGIAWLSYTLILLSTLLKEINY